MIRKLKEHSRLDHDDLAEIRHLNPVVRELQNGADIIRQGDRPHVSVMVVEGMAARYHILPSGRRQYLSFHLAGDMPDSQCLFVDQMDHAVCVLGKTTIALVAHKDLIAAFVRRPNFAFAIWRETLIDAAIFREAITNNSGRSAVARMAHLFCELFYRARASGLTRDYSCQIPISLVQLGEALGLSIATINRALADIRDHDLADLKNGVLTINDWSRLSKRGEFTPQYLHLRRPPF